MGEQIEDLEEEVLERAEPAVMEKINAFKREMNFISKSVRPATEAITPLAKVVLTDSIRQPAQKIRS